MKWYKKYLPTFEKPLSEVDESLIESVKNRLSQIQSADPEVSVVVIGYNEERRLFSCLWSLSETICKYPFEIIGVDNNSKDRTADVFAKTGVRYYTEYNNSCGYARNRGLEEAKGRYYICIDGDTIYPRDYVQIMTDALKRPGVVAASSLWSYVPDEKFPRYKMFFYELLRDINLFFLSFKRPERSVRGLVFAYHTELGRKVGYRVQIIRGEDGAMAYGLKRFGKIAFVRSRRARPYTCTGTLMADGSAGKAFVTRIVQYFTNLRYYFKKMKDSEFVDQESNLINKGGKK